MHVGHVVSEAQAASAACRRATRLCRKRSDLKTSCITLGWSIFTCVLYFLHQKAPVSKVLHYIYSEYKCDGAWVSFPKWKISQLATSKQLIVTLSSYCPFPHLSRLAKKKQTSCCTMAGWQGALIYVVHWSSLACPDFLLHLTPLLCMPWSSTTPKLSGSSELALPTETCWNGATF